MNNALYVGLSRQMLLQKQMNVVANNIANSDTAGFKAESLAQREDEETPVLKNGSPAVGSIKFVQDAGIAINFEQGPLKQTGATFDLGLQGEGLFEVQTAAGNRYTRDGRFTVDAQGQMVDVAGNAVLSSTGAPIQIDPTKTAPSIAHDGTVSQDGVIAGKVGVFKFADRTKLMRQGANLFDAVGQAATPDTATAVQQGMIENANVDAIQQMTRMIAVSRAYEQIASMMDQTGNTSDQSIQRLGKVN